MVQGSLAHRLRVLRAERGLTLREAASLTGVAKETISDIERALRHPHTPTLAKIAKGYGVPVDELLEEPVPLAEASEEDVDRNRVLMMMHLVLGTPDIVTPEAAGVVRQGMREKLKTG